MNTNELLAAGAVAGAHGQHIGIGLVVLALLVLGTLGFGAVRLNKRLRLNRQPSPVTKPEPPIPAQEPPSCSQPPPSPGPVPARRASFAHPNGGWAVETHGLTKRFGTTVAVDGVELLVPRGSAFGYLGPNGAGKTTLIRTLLGLTNAGLTVTLPAGASRELIADINRRLVGAGISVYGLREVQTSLEDWFLSVTSRLGEPS